jgi:hypothetical protein
MLTFFLKFGSLINIKDPEPNLTESGSRRPVDYGTLLLAYSRFDFSVADPKKAL